MVDGIYRICNPPTRDAPISFNQFLIDDERPTLIHTGFHEAYDAVRAAVAKALIQSGLPKWSSVISRPTSAVGWTVSRRGARLRTRGERAWRCRLISRIGATAGQSRACVTAKLPEIGRRSLRFLETPHVHHWDSMMVFDEATRSLFPADLIQPGAAARGGGGSNPKPCSNCTAPAGSSLTKLR